VFAHGDFDVRDLVAAKSGRTVSVCIPARNEAATIGPIVQSIVTHLTAGGGGLPLVDEVVVVDDGSTDGTGDRAARAGARVIGAVSATSNSPLSMPLRMTRSISAWLRATISCM